MTRLATFVPKSSVPTSDPAALTVRQVNDLPDGAEVYVAAKLMSGICYAVQRAAKRVDIARSGSFDFVVDGRAINFPTGRVYTDLEAAKARCRASMTSSIEWLQSRLEKLDA